LTEGFTVSFLPKALKTLSKLHPDVKRKVTLATQALGQNPHPPTSKRVIAPTDMYRIRVGDYRVIYAVEKHRLVVLVIALGHRRDVYRGLKG
jgi:mRNA interferase RelE/StbE